MGPHLIVLRMTLCAQGSLLVGLGALYRVLGMEPESAAYKASTCPLLSASAFPLMIVKIILMGPGR